MFHTTALTCTVALDLSKPCRFVESGTYLWCLLLGDVDSVAGERDLSAGLPQALGILKFRTRPIPTQFLPTKLQHHGLRCMYEHMADKFLILREREVSFKTLSWALTGSLSLAAPGEHVLNELV